MTVSVNVSFRLDWIQLLKQCRQGFPWLNWRLSVGFILWHHVDGKVAISHIHNYTTSFIPGGKKWKENSLFIHQLNKFWDWISLVRFSSLSFYSLETILLKITRLGWPSFPELLHIYICCLSTNINNTLLLSSSRMAPNYPGLQLFTPSPPRQSRAGMCNHFSMLLGHSSCLWGGSSGEVLRLPSTTSHEVSHLRGRACSQASR